MAENPKVTRLRTSRLTPNELLTETMKRTRVNDEIFIVKMSDDGNIDAVCTNMKKAELCFMAKYVEIFVTHVMGSLTEFDPRGK